MALAIMLGFGSALLVVEFVLYTWRHRRQRRLAVRRHPSGRGPAPTPDGPVQYRVTALDPEGIERLLTRRLVFGTITSEVYRHWMTKLAAGPDSDPVSVDVTRAFSLDVESRLQLARLATEMPELPLATLSAGVSLVRFGATVDDLVRLLGLRPDQALRIATKVTR